MYAATTIREIAPEEISLVGGAWTWDELAAAMAAGAFVGGIGAAAATAGIGIVPGAMGGALTAGMSYLIQDYIMLLLSGA